MTNEVKEILDKLEIVARKHTIEVCEDGSKIETMPASVVDELRLNNYSAKILLDYIINLQKENHRLKELCDKYEEEHSNEFQCWKRNRKELLDKRARIEKAIEHIEHNWIDYESAKSFITYDDMLDVSYLEIRQLLDILRGDE